MKKKKSEIGASLIEYTLLVALISVVSMSGITVFGEQVDDKLKANAEHILKAGNDSNTPGCGTIYNPTPCPG